jgi:hypothetical protein
MLTVECRMVNKFSALSPISFKHNVFLLSVLKSTPNHTPLKYRCLKNTQVRPYLSIYNNMTSNNHSNNGQLHPTRKGSGRIPAKFSDWLYSMWYYVHTHFLMVKNLHLMNKMFDKLLVLWMLHNLFRGSFASFDMRQVFVHQIYGNDGKCLLTSSLICSYFVTRDGRWWQLRTFHDLPFEFIEVEVLIIKVVNRYKSTIFTRSHCQAECKLPFIQCSIRA